MCLYFRLSALMIVEITIGLWLLQVCTLKGVHSFLHPKTTTTSSRPALVRPIRLVPIFQHQTKMDMVDESMTTDTTTTSIKEKPFNCTTDIGVIAPTGFWDPLNLSEDIDAATYTQYRTAEIKHGRVAMLCVIGYIVPEFYKFPGDIAPGLSFQSIPNGVAAIDSIPSLGWMQIIFLIGAVDHYGYLGSYDFGRAPALPDEVLYQRQQSELTHGRLAMLASMELLRHDAQNYIIPNYDGLGDQLITGLPFIY
jgi:Chlorophyll A-B binding protein